MLLPLPSLLFPTNVPLFPLSFSLASLGRFDGKTCILMGSWRRRSRSRDPHGEGSKRDRKLEQKETLARCLPPRPSQSAFLYSKPSRFWSLNDRREEWRVRKRNEKDAWRGSVPFLSPAIFLYIGDLRIPIRPRLNFLFMAKPLQSFLIIQEIIMKREVRVYSTGKVIPRSRRENNAFQFPGKR